MTSKSSPRALENEEVVAEREGSNVEPLVYDEIDRRLMDTFPASDAVARY